jgi:cytochrome c-type biogenesis protein CcmH
MKWLCVIVLMISTASYADTLSVKNQERANSLYEIVRCPVCNGQSLAGSEASIAQDLRMIINTKINNNLSDEQIKNDLVLIYGEEILFEPPVDKKTFLLNYGVWIFMVFVMLIFLYRYHKKNKMVQGHDANHLHKD